MAARIKWMRSEECGYSPGHLVADFPRNRSLSLSRRGRRWVLAVISRQSRTAEWSETYATKQRALEVAEEELVKEESLAAHWEQLRLADEAIRREDWAYYLSLAKESR